MLRVVDLFCGSGGFSLGLTRAGLDVVAGFDNYDAALAVHRANLPPRATASNSIRIRHRGRPSKHTKADLFDLLAVAPDIAEFAPDVVVGGPPCVAFSTAGPQDGDDNPAAKLTEAFACVVAISRPAYFVMENVYGVRDSRVYSRSWTILKKAGYGLTPYECDMSRFGVGQSRRRLLLMGCLGEADGWAAAYMDAHKQERQTTVRDILGDSAGELYFRIGHRGTDGGTKVEKPRRSFRSVDEPGAVLTTSLTRQASSDDGYVVREADVRFFEQHGLFYCNPGGASSAGTRTLDKPLPTMTSHSADGPGGKYRYQKGDVINVHDLPMLSLDQLSLLAGYPSDWIWHPDPENPTTQTDQVRMMANTVPPPVSEIVGKVIIAHSRGEQAPMAKWAMPEGFDTWLKKRGGVKEANIPQRLSEVRAVLKIMGSRELPFVERALQHVQLRPEYVKAPPSRRSNLLKAVRLYYDYLGYRKRLKWVRKDWAYDMPDEPTAPIPKVFRKLALKNFKPPVDETVEPSVVLP